MSQDSNLKNVVVVLGTFHLWMSYIGCQGFIMNGSGLQELWSTVYAKDSAKMMITGHAFARALRAHILTFTVLGMKIWESVKVDKDDQLYIKQLFSRFHEADDENCDDLFEDLTSDDLQTYSVIR